MGERDGEFKGLIQGVEARADRDFGDRAGAAQIELFDPGADADLAPPCGVAGSSSLPARRGGRPAGALNRRSTSLAKYFAARHRDPAAALGELSDCDPLDLWAWFKTHDEANAPSLVEVVRLQAAVRRDLLPYIHGKVPQKLDTGGKRPVFMMQVAGETVDQALDGVLSIEDGITDLD